MAKKKNETEEILEVESPEEYSGDKTLQDAMRSIAAQEVKTDEYIPSENVLDVIESINKARNLDALFNIRRKVRYRLFRIRQGGKYAEAHDHGLKAHIERQFQQGMSWANFTFDWDVAPNNPLLVIHRSILNMEWVEMGGGFTAADKMTPPAFTKQS